MTRPGTLLALLGVLLTFAGRAAAEGADPAAILELGGAGEASLGDGRVAAGPAVGAEVTPIEGWLEIEGGVAPLLGAHRTEWDTDLLFKKPFTLSETVELMAGVGPEWVHRAGGGEARDALAGEAALDLMIWPWPERRLGWYVEPTYGYEFARGHEQSLGLGAGLLIPLP